MKLIIAGRPCGLNVDQGLIRSSINYYSDIFCSAFGSICNELKVRVNIMPNLQTNYNCTGLSVWIDKPFNPRSFIIEVDSHLDERSMLITVAHELCHVRQLSLGIYQITDDSRRWNGIVVDESTHYYDLPWEIDAHGREYGLYDRFIEHSCSK